MFTVYGCITACSFHGGAFGIAFHYNHQLNNNQNHTVQGFSSIMCQLDIVFEI